MFDRPVNRNRPPIPVPQQGDDVGIHRMVEIRKLWHENLESLIAEGSGSKPAWPVQELLEWVSYLILMQSGYRGDGINIDGAWCLAEAPAMPSDARVDFIYWPSYIALATLSWIHRNHPAVTAVIPAFESSLRRGLDFASGRNFGGHGYESDQERIAAIEVLAKGEVFSVVRAQPGFSWRFERAMNRAREALQRRLADNQGWGSIDEDRARKALQLLGPPIILPERPRLRRRPRREG